MPQVDATEFFERVRAASIDAARCKRILESLEEIATRLGGAGFEVRVHGSGRDRLERSLAKYIDTERRLQARIAEDYQLIDLGNAIVYGSPQVDGIADIVRPKCQWWADAVYWHYLGLLDWATINVRVGHANSGRAARSALELCDRLNLVTMHLRHHDAEGWSIDV